MIALAVGAVLVISLYNVYKPAVNNTAHDVFDKVRIGRMEAGNEASNHNRHNNNSNINNNTNRPWNNGSYLSKSKDENERAFDYWIDNCNKLSKGLSSNLSRSLGGSFLGGDTNNSIWGVSTYSYTTWNSGHDYSKLNSDAPASALDYTKPYICNHQDDKSIIFFAKNDNDTPKALHANPVSPNIPVHMNMTNGFIK